MQKVMSMIYQPTVPQAIEKCPTRVIYNKIRLQNPKPMLEKKTKKKNDKNVVGLYI